VNLEESLIVLNLYKKVENGFRTARRTVSREPVPRLVLIVRRPEVYEYEPNVSK
jgi:hypothetical protein